MIFFWSNTFQTLAPFAHSESVYACFDKFPATLVVEHEEEVNEVACDQDGGLNYRDRTVVNDDDEGRQREDIDGAISNEGPPVELYRLEA